MSKQVADVLDKARQRLVEKGWCQGTEENGSGECCALGAIIRSTRSPDLELDARIALRELTEGYGIESWNDHPERTKAQVLGAFKRAANAERKKP